MKTKKRIEIVKIFAKNFLKLSKQLKESSTKELHTIKNSIKTKVEEAASNLIRHYKILSIA